MAKKSWLQKKPRKPEKTKITIFRINLYFLVTRNLVENSQK